MINTHKNLIRRYKHIPGKIILRKDDFIIAANTEHEIDSGDLLILSKQHEQTDFTPDSRLRWLKVSTSNPDRAGDEMEIDGAETENFLRNPQFLWMHGQTQEPVHTIGKIVKLVKTSNALYALAQYTEPEFSELAEKIYQMDLAGFLPANSIGFRP